MNPASWALNYRVVTIVVSLVVLLAGIEAYLSLGRLEDPDFPLKQAVVVTPYPGATPEEVADEVTDPLEEAIQQLEQVDYVTSQSIAGRSTIKVFIRDQFGGDDLPQIWDELRRKVSAAAVELPPRAGPPRVNDDFGDVYGILLYIYGDGFDINDIHDFAKFLRDELLLVEGVGGVALQGEPREAIYLDFSPARLGALGADVRTLVNALEGQGSVAPAAAVDVGRQRLAVVPSGELDSVTAIRNLMVQTREGVMLRLGDIARVSRGFVDPPASILRFNDYRAIAVGVSTVAGGNVVEMGEAVQQRLDDLRQQTPVGIEFGVVSMQPKAVERAVAGFTLGLVESVVIVIGVLLLAMGLRAGLLIGGILLLTILGSFIVMKALAVDLQRISLGALIIALGMLVDNAIVVVEGIIAGSKQGLSRGEAGRRVVRQTAWPLLGATVIAVLAFAPIGLSPDSTGDYTGSLFTVIWVSLGLSWVFAVTSTPVFGSMFLRSPRREETGDPYAGPVFRAFRAFLERALAWRWLTVVVLLVLLATAVVGFGKAKQGFFPASARPQFMVDVWMRESTRIEAVDDRLRELAEWILTLEGVTAVATNAGSGALRFELTYSPEMSNASYGQLLVSVENDRIIDDLMAQIEQRLASHYPDARGWPWRMVLGPGGEAKIQARVRGPDPDTLRALGDQFETIMAADPYVKSIRTDWRQRTVRVNPIIDEAQAARYGITRRQVNQALQLAFDGVNVGLYRESNQLIPILMRSEADEVMSLNQLPDVL
ncbi:MAG: efflux RND transporter permease subunit, partial [Planctomycetota bacterium]|nr:efflux RND transporter permease subunit [Planctomycetota bacterium]